MLKHAVLSFLILCIIVSFPIPCFAESIIINEFLASNSKSGLVDEDGDTVDWIELYNPTTQAVDVSGWYLTDDVDERAKWAFPEGTHLEPQAFLVVFASGKDRSTPNLHTSFKLSSSGEYLGLVGPDGQTVVHAFTPQFPSQLTDISYGLTEPVVNLVTAASKATYHVPTSLEPTVAWQQLDFQDSSWTQADLPLGFSPAETISSQQIGDTASVGNYFAQAGVYGMMAGGMGMDGNTDSCFYVYAPLKGDGELTVRIQNMDQGREWAQAGVMVRETLSPDARFVAQTITPGHGPMFQSRRTVGADSLSSHGGASPTPYWVRIVRQDNRIYGYHSPDGSDWRLQGIETLSLGHEAFIGMCVATQPDNSQMAIIIDNVSFGSRSAGELKQSMLATNASLWTRVTFPAEEIQALDSMQLKMRYEDGFIAYLNGSEIARDNVTGSPHADSAADRDRPDAESSASTTYDVSQHLHLLREGENVLAVHALNDDANNQTFLVAPLLTAVSKTQVTQYFDKPTPGQPNRTGATDTVASPEFSVTRGFYEQAFDLKLTSETEGAEIYYTTNGTPPSAVLGSRYDSPLRISETTCLRAIAVKPGWIASPVLTQTYIFLDQVLTQPRNPEGFPQQWVSGYYNWSYPADYGMDPQIVNDPAYRNRIKDDLQSLPTMSLVMDLDDLFDADKGIYSNTNLNHPGGVEWERPGSVEYFDAHGEEQGFDVTCGVRVVGGWGAKPEFIKHSFRLLFKRDYGPTKLRYPFFGPDAAEEFDTITLRANFNDGYVAGGNRAQYLRDEFCRRLQLALGQRVGSGTFIHLYVNGLYWGLYNAVERPEASFSATYFGGSKEDWDAYNSGRTTGESSMDSWNGLMAAINQDLRSMEGYQRLQGRNADGTPNPDYVNWLDMENYIDYLIMNFFVGNGDWPGHNWYAAFNKVNPSGFKSYSWDAEHVMGLGFGWNNRDNAPPDVTSASGSICRPYSRLRGNSEFRLLFADRVHKAFFNDGPCYVNPSNPDWDPQHPARNRPAALYAKLADWIEGGMVCESARWGDVRGGRRRLDQWRNERDWILHSLFPRRSADVLDQFRRAGLYPYVDAPSFFINYGFHYQGHFDRGENLYIVASEGQVYYTLDGTDPRNPTTPQLIDSVTLLAADAAKRVLVPTRDVDPEWLSKVRYNDTNWLAGAGGVGYDNSVDYDPYIDIDVDTPMNGINGSCYIRIPFSLNNNQLTGLNYLALRMRYDDGFVAYLNGVEVARANAPATLTWESTATGGHDDAAAVTFEEFIITTHLDELKTGNNLLAIHGLNISLTSSDFLIMPELIGGEIEAGGQMLSASALAFDDPLVLTESVQIKTRCLHEGVWSALNEAIFAIGPVAEDLRITELMYHPPDPNTEYIELQNTGTVPINLNRVSFTQGVSFTFPSLELDPGHTILVVQELSAFETKYGEGWPIAGQYEGSLDNAGERIELRDAGDRIIHDFRYRDGWYNSTDGLGNSLIVIDPAAAEPNGLSNKDDWRASTKLDGSPGLDEL